MVEINLMEKYPTTRRNLDDRAMQRTEQDREIARRFDAIFFDGERRYGYGGYNYNPKFWTGVVEDMIKHYNLTNESKILDVGCAKGFMLYDFTQALPGIEVRGIDISRYAIRNSKEEVKYFLDIGNANDLRFPDKYFDLAISITTVHNLQLKECKKAIKEVQRVGKKSFITVDAWRNEEEKGRMLKWNLTAKTLMSTDDWKKLFDKIDYKGDYYWFIP